jgi:hypothetical protein
MQRHAIRRAHGLVPASILLVGLAIAHHSAHAQAFDSNGIRAVPTYEAVGLYWSNPGANAATGCQVTFRKSGDGQWTSGLDLWFDAATNECRGSLVSLAAGTSYDVRFNLPGLPVAKAVTFSTWSNQLPVARTIKVASGSATLDITAGGSASTGYVVYDGTGSTLDAANRSQFNVSVNASFVIVRGFTLKGAQQDAIRISPDVKDVVIEDNDVSGWGRTRDGTWGTDMDSGVRAVCRTESLERVTVQRNRIHDPRYSANSWTDGHPAGPQGITFSYCGGNHVFRWNEIYSTNGNHFNDGMGGEDNFSTSGFPNKDSDIYGNKISQTWDDGIEAEGGDMNVRIWGNYLDRTATGIASTVDSVGPLYIFRNVFNRNQFYDKRASDSDERQPFFKSGSSPDFRNGRRYIFHNTMLQATQAGSQYGLGGGAGIGGTGNTQLIHNTVSMNNIYHLWKPNSAVYQVGADNAFRNDMFNGNMGAAIVGGINATPAYAAGNGWQSESGGMYQLAASTPGYDQAVRIANFNDGYLGNAPDVGAAEAGAAPMAFGIAAASASGATTTGIAIPGDGVAQPVPVPTAPSGSESVSTTIDSSLYTASAGQSVTFTVNLMGNSGTPTGTVTFQDNGSALSGCTASAVSGGSATCTTSALSGGSHSMTGLYSGDATYGAGLAGPITETITGGTVTTKFGMDSSAYTIARGQSVTFTATVPNNASTGAVTFLDDYSPISGCYSVPVSNGIARCTTSGLAAGSHPIKGSYSGGGGNAAGIAGPITETVH